MSGYYSKAEVELEFGTSMANTDDFITVFQVKKRLAHLDAVREDLFTALDYVRREKEALEKILDANKKVYK